MTAIARQFYGYEMAARPARARMTLTGLATILIVLLACFVSGQLLIDLGIDYMLGPNPLPKIHPATYLAVLTFFVLYFGPKHAEMNRIIFHEYWGVAYGFIALLVLLAYIAIFLSVPGTGLPDTWLLPFCLFVLLSLLNRLELTVLARAMDAFFLINSVVGIYEFRSGVHIIPITVANAILGAMEMPYEYRACAFLGHPLTASYLTGAYILFLLFSPRIKSVPIRMCLLFVQLLGLVSFGSRAAMVLVPAFAVLIIGRRMFLAAGTGKLKTEDVIYIALGILLIIVAIPIVLQSGFADKALERFTVDHGSAQARTNALDMLSRMDTHVLWFGQPLEDTFRAGTQNGIGSGIESFWLGFMMNTGLTGCFIFFPALGRFCWDLTRRTNLLCGIILVYFFACCTTSVSLSSKSLMLPIMVALCFTSFIPKAPRLMNLAPRQRRPIDLRSHAIAASMQSTISPRSSV